jgi:putative ABC transport system substrate-binding protein
MKRREFITLLGGAVAWPLAARAQQPEKMRHLGVLVSGSEQDPEMQARIAGLRDGLQRFGWSPDVNLRIDYRFASASPRQAQQLAKELISLRPDVILAFASLTALALQRETKAVPIVFVGIADPVGIGLVESLARPGANVTGSLLYEQSIVGKWLAMLKEIAPQLARVAILFNPKTGPYRYYESAAEDSAASLAIALAPTQIESAADIERTLQSFADTPNGGLLVLPDLTALLHRDLIISLAARYRLPAIYQARFWVAAGGLMSYGADRVAAHRHAAYYIDRILRGTNPADLPVQAPTKFETTLNLKTAKRLGLSVPPGLLVAADEVIE